MSQITWVFNMLNYLRGYKSKHTKQKQNYLEHYGDVILSATASQITSVSMIYWTVSSGTDQRKHQNSVSLAFVRGIHRWPVNSPHKGPVTRNMFPCDDVIMVCKSCQCEMQMIIFNLPEVHHMCQDIDQLDTQAGIVLVSFRHSCHVRLVLKGCKHLWSHHGFKSRSLPMTYEFDYHFPNMTLKYVSRT